MKNIMVLAILFSTITLSGCAAYYQPSISYISDSLVKVQIRINIFELLRSNPFASALASIAKEADRGCGVYGKTAVYLSTYCIARDIAEYCVAKEFLFACK